MPVVRQRVEDRVGVQREGRFHPTRGLVVPEVDGFPVVMIPSPDVPGPHQGVLQDGKLVGVVAHVVEKALDEALGDGGPSDLDRLFDGIPSLLPAQPGNQVLPVVDGFRESGNLGAVSEVIGAHGEGDEDVSFALVAGLEEEVDEGAGRLLGAEALLPEAEDFLELVDHDEDIGLRVGVRLPEGLDQTLAAAVQGGLEPQLRLLVLGIVEIGVDQGAGEVLDGSPSRLHDHHFPAGSDLGHGAAVEGGKQPGPHQ